MIKKNQKGVTLVTLIIAITIILIIATTLIYNISTGNKIKQLNNMYQDIEKLKDKIDLYYSRYHRIPKLEGRYDNVDNIKHINPNDSDTYYVIDLEALENITLNYGKDYKNYKTNPSIDFTDLYLVNERSHAVYYIKGIQFDNDIYYTIPDENSMIELNEMLTISVIGKNDDFISVKMEAIDKTEGITNLTVMIDEKPYKIYNYTSEHREIKAEILQIELTNVQRDCYFKVENETGKSKNSNHIVLEPKIISVKKLKVGDYIKYDTGVKGVGVITCRVLYPIDSEYGLQIISDKNVGEDITLGGDTWEEGKIIYNGITEKLNQEASKYVNGEYAYDGRCVGSIPTIRNGMFVDKNKLRDSEGKIQDKLDTVSIPESYIIPTGWTKDTGCYEEDTNYITDQIALEKANMWITGEKYWLVSRHILLDLSRISFRVRNVSTSSDLGSNNMCRVRSDGTTGGNLHTYGLRPCISLKSNIIKITDGDGTSVETAYIIGK